MHFISVMYLCYVILTGKSNDTFSTLSYQFLTSFKNYQYSPEYDTPTRPTLRSYTHSKNFQSNLISFLFQHDCNFHRTQIFLNFYDGKNSTVLFEDEIMLNPFTIFISVHSQTVIMLQEIMVTLYGNRAL